MHLTTTPAASVTGEGPYGRLGEPTCSRNRYGSELDGFSDDIAEFGNHHLAF